MVHFHVGNWTVKKVKLPSRLFSVFCFQAFFISINFHRLVIKEIIYSPIVYVVILKSMTIITLISTQILSKLSIPLTWPYCQHTNNIALPLGSSDRALIQLLGTPKFSCPGTNTSFIVHSSDLSSVLAFHTHDRQWQ